MLKEQLSFFDTIKAKEKLPEYEQKAHNQEQLILRQFLYGQFTALEISERLSLHESSARRACHVLCKKGLIIRTDEQRIGKYGKPNYVYKIK